jgi:hypothetical protein
LRKKSIRFATDRFGDEVTEIDAFVRATAALPAQHVSWAYDHAIIKLYRAFERMMLDVLVGVMNNDTATTGAALGVPLPKHLSDEVCQYLVVGVGYFDFKGRDGLLQLLQRFVPNRHWLVTAVKKEGYRESLERLSALRNYAAHGSMRAKAAAKKATGHERLASAGSWLKRSGRFGAIAKNLRALATDLAGAAPR